VLVLALSACQATVRVGIDARSNGSGTVSVTVLLDKEAAQAIPDLAQQLRTSDLVKAGWQIKGPTGAAGGGSTVMASKPFANAAEEAQVVGELSGPTGPFHDFQLKQQRSFFATRTTFSGHVDLTCGLRCFGDSQLQQQLGGASLGLDPAKLQQNSGIILDRIFKFEVSVRLPGSVQSSNAPSQAGNGAQWQPKLGDQATLTATARVVNSGRIALLVVVGVVLLVLAIGVTLVLRRQRRPQRPSPTQGPDDDRLSPIRRVVTRTSAGQDLTSRIR
jgi:hypothetical protein